jgi:cystathionine beta-lyase
MDFETILPMREALNGKWTRLESATGIDPDTGIAMWVADSDYATAPCVRDVLRRAVDIGVFCYGYDNEGYLGAVQWWMKTRHDWQIDTDWIVTTQGLGHAIATCIDVWSEPGEGVAYFTPVYHEFRLKTQRAGRRPVELPMALVDDRYQLDWDAAEAAITPDTKVLLFCSPQNPSGRVWTAEELRDVAEFAERHDLILVSDEVHCDLIYDDGTGTRHIPTDIAAPEHRARTVTLFAGSKTFNLAGLRVGQMIIPDAELRETVQQRLTALNYDPATLGVMASQAAFSEGGNEWLAAQMQHLTRVRDIFDDGINAIPGVKSMRLQATFLPWVDFSGTGMSAEEITRRVHGEAGIGTADGARFGTGGESFHRFNIALPTARIEDAVARMQAAFSDLQ